VTSTKLEKIESEIKLTVPLKTESDLDSGTEVELEIRKAIKKLNLKLETK